MSKQPFVQLRMTHNVFRIFLAVVLTVLCICSCVWMYYSPEALAKAVYNIETTDDIVTGANSSPVVSKKYTAKYDFTVTPERPYLDNVGFCLNLRDNDTQKDRPDYTITVSQGEEILASETLDLESHMAIGEYGHYYFLHVEQILQPGVTYTLTLSCDNASENASGLRVYSHPSKSAEQISYFSDGQAFTPDFSITTGEVDYSLYWIPMILMAIALIIALFSLLVDVTWCRRRPSLIAMILFNGLLCAFFSLVAVENLNNSGGIFCMEPFSILVNLITYICLYLLVYAVTGSPFFSICSISILLTFGSIVNYFTLEFRGTPVMPADIFAITTAANVVGQYEIGTNAFLLWSCAMTICVCAISYLVAGRPITRKVFLHAGMRLLALGSSLAFFMFLNTTQGCIALQVPTNAWNPTLANQQNGFVVHFTENIRALFLAKPSGYSHSKVDQIASTYSSDKETSELPNIIFIMNESLADFEFYDSLSTSDPILPYLHSLKGQANALTGYVEVPVYGGGTSTSEFQALTGVSDRDYFSTSPYATYILRDTPSIASVLGELGYTTIAAHPAWGGNWNRDRAYDRLGFDDFYDISKLTDLSTLRGLTSDSSFYSFLTRLDEDSDEPLFLFAVTIQNHGGYEEEDFDEPISIYSPEGDYPQAQQYLNLARISDDAFRELTEYYSTVDDPTLIVMFGDHFPGIESEFTTAVCTPNDLGILATQITPFVLWANYDLDKDVLPEEGSIFSVSFLQSVLMDAAGLPKTGWQQFLSDVLVDYPVVSKFGTMDASGNPVEDSLDISLLQDYSYLQYALLGPARSRPEAFFTFAE